MYNRRSFHRKSQLRSVQQKALQFQLHGDDRPEPGSGLRSGAEAQVPPGSTGINVPMDPCSPLALDSSYYLGLMQRRGLFTSDQTLLSSPALASLVKAYRNNNFLFNKNFAAAMVKMGNIGVLTGKAGEILLNCRLVNK